MRRSRRKGQMRRTCSLRCISNSAKRISGVSVFASVMISPCGPKHLTGTPELNARGTMQWRGFETGSITAQHWNAIGHRVTTMTQNPGHALALFFGWIIAGIPTNSRRIQQNFRAGQGHQTCRFRIPLIPANQHAQVCRLKSGSG